MEDKVGFIAGAFDVIHPGYIDMFEFMKNRCDYLCVGLHSDPSLERKDKLKPVLTVEERTKILLAIKYIDEVIPYETEQDLERILRKNKIDFRFLGDDYLDKDYTCKELNIPVIWIDRSHGWSSTKYKQKLIESFYGL
jgi:glycerol-3-phosphate cytidylyltransferase